MDTIKFPCKECNTDVLWPLPAPHSHVAECAFCGHPNDTPDPTDVSAYNTYLLHEKWRAEGRDFHGVVVFFDITNINGVRGLKEIGRADYECGFHALERYANTPNPASQLLYYVDDETRTAALKELAENIVNPKWLENLFDQI